MSGIKIVRVETRIRYDELQALRTFAATLEAPYTDNLAAAIRALLRDGMEAAGIAVDFTAPLCRRCQERPRVERKNKAHGSYWRAYCKECESEMAAARLRRKYAEDETFRKRARSRARTHGDQRIRCSCGAEILRRSFYNPGHGPKGHSIIEVLS